MSEAAPPKKASKEAPEPDEEELATSLHNSDVCEKYRVAAKIVNKVLVAVAELSVAGALVIDLCKAGDELVAAECANIYNKKVKGEPIEKGLAFPTCVSINECVCHNSPLASEEQPPVKDGDVVKIDLGCYIDGYIAVGAHTTVVGDQPTAAKPMVGPFADCITAAHIASEVATKMVKPGNTNQQVTAAINNVAKTFGVNCVAGCLSHQMKRYIIDGNKTIILKEDVEQQVEDHAFAVNEVYAIDVCMSTGEGTPREADMRTSVYKRSVDKQYRLKMRASRYLFNEVNAKHPTLPFTLRALPDERQARMGVVECLKHDLMQPYPVLYERAGDHVVHFKFTVLVLTSGTVRVTGLPFDSALYSSEKVPDDETAAILAQSSKKKKKKKKKAAEGEKA